MRTDEWVGFALPWGFFGETDGEAVGCICGEEIGQFFGLSIIGFFTLEITAYSFIYKVTFS